MKIDRNPRFEHSNIDSLDIFLNAFYFCQHMVINSEFSRRPSNKSFYRMPWNICSYQALRFIWRLNLHLKVSRFYYIVPIFKNATEDLRNQLSWDGFFWILFARVPPQIFASQLTTCPNILDQNFEFLGNYSQKCVFWKS